MPSRVSNERAIMLFLLESVSEGRLHANIIVDCAIVQIICLRRGVSAEISWRNNNPSRDRFCPVAWQSISAVGVRAPEIVGSKHGRWDLEIDHETTARIVSVVDGDHYDI